MLQGLLIRSKLMVLMLLSSIVALVLVGGAWAFYDRKLSRRSAVLDLETMADMVAANSDVALSFGEAESAAQGMQSLRASPEIQRAYLFDAAGRPFAEYHREGTVPPPEPPEPLPGGDAFDAHGLTVFRPVIMGGERIGTLCLVSNLAELRARSRFQTQVILAVTGGSCLIALALALRLQKVISGPILHLTQTIRRVRDEMDYTVRVRSSSRDEMGYLARAFDDMLGELQEHREHLEEQVARRTEELTRLNAQLTVSMEEARAGLLAKAEFLATMSHEIRTPMNGVLGMIDLLMETRLEGDQRKYAEVVRSSAESLLRIINDILDFSKIEAGKMGIEQVAFEVPDLVREVAGLLERPARDKALSLEHAVDPTCPPQLVGDPTRLRQVITNLVANALKFTERGSVRLDVRVEEADEERVFVRFEVTDTGIGIPPERMSRLFEAFSQVDSSTTRKYGGTGLGLAICKRLVELMHGMIGVRSDPGRGSVFWFTVPLGRRVQPLAEVPAPLPAPRAEAASAEQARRVRDLRILLVEDHPVNALVVQKSLERLGHACRVAPNGRVAVDAVREEPFDVILMDCQMPVMDGFQATRAIRAWEAGMPQPRRPLRIVALTANAMAGDRERCLAAGMDDYLTKPVRPKTLAAALEGVARELFPGATAA